MRHKPLKLARHCLQRLKYLSGKPLLFRFFEKICYTVEKYRNSFCTVCARISTFGIITDMNVVSILRDNRVIICSLIEGCEGASLSLLFATFKDSVFKSYFPPLSKLWKENYPLTTVTSYVFLPDVCLLIMSDVRLIASWTLSDFGVFQSPKYSKVAKNATETVSFLKKFKIWGFLNK